jgi:hypothetical protein
MKRILAILLAAACMPALADLVPVGPPEQGGSWQQCFSESGVGAFDLVGVQIASAGDFFKSPAQLDFNEASWSVLLDGTVMASAWGDSVGSLEWDIHFSGDVANPLTFDYVVFSGNELVSAARAEWGGSLRTGWTVTPFPGGYGAFWLPSPADLGVPIPVPSAVLLGAVGLMCLRWVKRHAG